MSQTPGNMAKTNDLNTEAKLPGHPPQQNDKEQLLAIGEPSGPRWHEVFHSGILVIAVVGEVVSAPSYFVFLGRDAGVVTLTLFWIIALYFLVHMVTMHQISQRELDLDHDPEKETSGKQAGLWTRISPKTFGMVGANTVCMITGGRCVMKLFERMNCPNVAHPDDSGPRECIELSLMVWIGIVAMPQFILAPFSIFNQNPIPALSLAAVTIFSSIYPKNLKASHSAAGWVSSHMSRQLAGPSPSSTSSNDYDEDAMKSLFITNLVALVGILAVDIGAIIFYRRLKSAAGYQATDLSIPSKLFNVSVHQMATATAFVNIMYSFQLPTLDYLMRGDHLTSPRLGMLWAVKNAADVAVVIHAIGNYQYYAMHVYNSLEMALAKRFNLTPSRVLQLVTRSSYVFLTGFLACALLFSVPVLEVLQYLVFAPITYFLPFIVWLRVFKPKPCSLAWTVNMVCIAIGILAATFIFVNSAFDGLWTFLLFFFLLFLKESTKFLKDLILGV